MIPGPRDAFLAMVSVALLACQAAGVAQDTGMALPLEQAPYHLPVFANEHVLVLKIEIPPGGDTGYHTHVRDSVSVSIEAPDVVNQEAGQAPGPRTRGEPGRVTYVAYSKDPPRTHKNLNVGTTPFRNVSFIFQTPGPRGLTPSSRADVPAYAQVLDNDRVRGWRLALEPGASAAAVRQLSPGIRIVVAGGLIVEQSPGRVDRPMSLRTGEVYWQEPGGPRAIRNAGASRVEILEFELK